MKTLQLILILLLFTTPLSAQDYMMHVDNCTAIRGGVKDTPDVEVQIWRYYCSSDPVYLYSTYTNRYGDFTFHVCGENLTGSQFMIKPIIEHAKPEEMLYLFR